MKKRFFTGTLPFFVVAIFLSSSLQASGSFSPPGGGGPGSAEFNKGKAIVSGRAGAGDIGCKQCHKFKRKALKRMKKRISRLVVDCNAHDPCMASVLDPSQLAALDVYFAKRYRLKFSSGE